MPALERPALLTFGIVVNAIHAAFMVLVAGFLFLGALGATGLTMSALPVLWPFSLLLGLGAFVLLVYVAFYLFVLAVCWRSWDGSRPWLWTLVVLSLIGIANTGPFSVVIGILTIVGALQYLRIFDSRAQPAS